MERSARRGTLWHITMHIKHEQKSFLMMFEFMFYFLLDDVPRSTPGNSEVFDSVIAILILRQYDKSMSGLVCNCISVLKKSY